MYNLFVLKLTSSRLPVRWSNVSRNYSDGVYLYVIVIVLRARITITYTAVFKAEHKWNFAVFEVLLYKFSSLCWSTNADQRTLINEPVIDRG